MTERVVPGLREALRTGIYEQCFSDKEREVGGVLIGRFRRRAPPVVDGWIPALEAESPGHELTFTHDTWEHVHAVIAGDYPGCRIVGWYHTHPGAGVYMSPHDLFIHRNFFPDESQIAVVIDPVAREEAIFCWTTDQKVKEYLRCECAFEPERAGLRRNSRIHSRARDRPPQPRVREPADDAVVVAGGGVSLATAIYLVAIGISIGIVLYEFLLK
jgi:proteasome lid subunit RPN8/RPN11